MLEDSARPKESTIKHNNSKATTTVAYLKKFIAFLIFCLEFEEHLCHFLGPPLKS